MRFRKISVSLFSFEQHQLRVSGDGNRFERIHRAGCEEARRNNGGARVPDQLIVLSMNLIRYLTKVSGFLNISSTERNRYLDSDSASFRTPSVDWVPPYPYCPTDVLFPVEKQELEYQILNLLPHPPLVVTSQEQALWEQLANENMGG